MYDKPLCVVDPFEKLCPMSWAFLIVLMYTMYVRNECVFLFNSSETFGHTNMNLTTFDHCPTMSVTWGLVT